MPGLPTYFDDFENPRHPLASKYPLTICTPHVSAWLHSHASNNPWMKDLYIPEVFLNTADAAERGIAEGDTVLVFNDRGTIEQPAVQPVRRSPGSRRGTCLFLRLSRGRAVRGQADRPGRDSAGEGGHEAGWGNAFRHPVRVVIRELGRAGAALQHQHGS